MSNILVSKSEAVLEHCEESDSNINISYENLELNIDKETGEMHEEKFDIEMVDGVITVTNEKNYNCEIFKQTITPQGYSTRTFVDIIYKNEIMIRGIYGKDLKDKDTLLRVVVGISPYQ